MLESCQLHHLKHIWVLLNVKRAILLTINNQDPFENLSSSFKIEKKFQINSPMDSSMILSVQCVVFQLISNYLQGSADLRAEEDRRINEKFKYASSLENIIVPENISQLPGDFPDEQANNSSFENEAMDTQEEHYNMCNIYSMWLYLCNLKA